VVNVGGFGEYGVYVVVDRSIERDRCSVGPAPGVHRRGGHQRQQSAFRVRYANDPAVGAVCARHGGPFTGQPRRRHGRQLGDQLPAECGRRVAAGRGDDRSVQPGDVDEAGRVEGREAGADESVGPRTARHTSACGDRVRRRAAATFWNAQRRRQSSRRQRQQVCTTA